MRAQFSQIMDLFFGMYFDLQETHSLSIFFLLGKALLLNCAEHDLEQNFLFSLGLPLKGIEQV